MPPGMKTNMASGLAAATLASSAEKSRCAERRVDLVDDLALVVALEAADHVLAGLVVGRQDEDLLDALVLGVLAEHRRRQLVLIGRRQEPGVAALAGERRGAGVRADQDGLGVRDRLGDRHQDVGEGRADDDLHLVALDQLLGLVDGDVGLQLVVLHDDLRVDAAELAAGMLDAQIEAVVDLLAERGLRSGQHVHQADAELLGLGRARSNGMRPRQPERSAALVGDPSNSSALHLSPNAPSVDFVFFSRPGTCDGQPGWHAFGHAGGTSLPGRAG